MPQCPQCYFDSPAYSQYCSKCGNNLPVEQMMSTTQPQILEPPPTNRRKRRSRTFIPGLGVFGLFRQDPQTGKWGCAPGCLISAILAVILILGGFLFFSQQHASGPANLSIGGSPTPGELLNVHGSNFPPDSSVDITVDGAHYAFTGHRLPMTSASIWNIVVQERTLHPSDTTVTVRSDGTFDTTITIPWSWTPGSRHVIQAQTLAKNSTATAKVQVTIIRKQTEPSPTATSIRPSPTPTATSSPPVVTPTATSIRPSPTPTATSSPPVVTPTATSISPSPTPTATSSPPVVTPTVTSISPSTGSNAGGTTVIIKGTGFTNVSSVSFGSSVLTQGNFTFNNDTSITVISPAGNSTVDILVTTPNGTSAKSSADQFTYIIPPPTVTNISPSSGSIYGGTSVVITGTGFTQDSSVSFGSAAVRQGNFTIDNDTQITVTSPAAGSGTVDVTVTTPGGTSAISLADQFTYNTPPTITSISPPSGSSNGGTSVVITGTGFTQDSSVSFGSTIVTQSNFTFNSDTSITVISPAGTGIVDIMVTTSSGGTSAKSTADQFTYNTPPTITGISPSSGSTDGGTYVTITGTGFTQDSSVSFGSIAVKKDKFTIISDTRITVTSPYKISTVDITVDITVTTASGTSAISPADQFRYIVYYLK